MAFDEAGRITAVEATIVANLGAYQSQFGACIPTLFCATMFSGQYAIPALHCRVLGVYTHTTPVDAYRGAGNPEITYVVERLIENGARERAGDPVEARARNLIPAERMPYASATGITYDVGDFPAVLDKARALADLDALRAEQARLRADGVLMGIGVAAFVRSGGAGPSRLAAALGARMGLWDVATVRVHPSGKITVLCGSHSHGQSHATTYAQIVADRFGCAMADIDVVEGDTDRIPHGLGTWASRSITVVGSALAVASDRIIDKGRRLAAHLMECAEGDVDFRAGAYAVRGTDRQMSFVEIADMAYRGADYPGRLRARAGGSGVLRPRRLQLSLRHPCGRGHRRWRDRRGAAHRLLLGGGRRSGDQPAGGRRPAPRRHRPGHRPGPAGGHPLRPGVGPASQRLLHGLRDAARRRPARLRPRRARDADRDQPARRQGRGRARHLRPAGRHRQRRPRRALAPRRAPRGDALHGRARVARDARGRRRPQGVDARISPPRPRSPPASPPRRRARSAPAHWRNGRPPSPAWR